MRGVVRWAVANGPSMNTLMIAIIIVGLFGLAKLRREIFPNFQLDIIYVTVPYPGASPSDVEEGICLKIEEKIRAINGIKKLTSVAKEGSGSVVAELEAGVDAQRIFNEIRSEVDSIPSFPEQAEKPTVTVLTIRNPAIRVALISNRPPSPEADRELRDVTENLRDRLLRLDTISQVEFNAPEYQIDVQIPEGNLREYNLTLDQVADIIRRQNIETPAGNIETPAGEMLLRVTDKRITGEGIAGLSVLTSPTNTKIRVSDLGSVSDAFGDADYYSWINGRPGLVLTVQKTDQEDLLLIADDVRRYITEEYEPPPGYEVQYWGNESALVRDRLRVLRENGILGLVLVFIVLGTFLDLRVAFWVAMGLPVAILGTCAIMWQVGETMNMISMFAFIMGIGILVDDAIVVSENIYRHRQMGKDPMRAAIDGTIEVAPSVIASVLTTVIAFLPMLFVSGVFGKFIAIMPVAVIAMLMLSVLESTMILPVHLSHEGKGTLWDRYRRSDAWVGKKFRQLGHPVTRVVIGVPFIALMGLVLFPFLVLALVGMLFRGMRRGARAGLHAFIERVYMPLLGWSLRYSLVVYALVFAMLVLTIGLIAGGVTPFVVFPKLDAEVIRAKVVFPTGTPRREVEAATAQIDAAARQLAQEREQAGEKAVKLSHREIGFAAGANAMAGMNESGAHAGQVTLELTASEDRETESNALISRWRELVGEIPGTTELSFGATEMGPAGIAIEFKVLGDDMTELTQAVETIKARLQAYAGVKDISSEPQPGKQEMRLRIKPRAEALGIRQDDLARTIRSAYFGEEVMRLQRGRHEVKVMVRYPPGERESYSAFEEIRIRTSEGEIPITELAEVTFVPGYSEINRVDQQRAITISADVDENRANAQEIINDLKSNVLPDVQADHPNIRYLWEGQAARTAESLESMLFAYIVAVFAMYGLLTVEFRSYLQPMIILAAIPFGFIGAVLGHMVMGLPVTLFSIFGLVALSGVVANDSIVLVDFINRRIGEGATLRQALIESGLKRFRPVFLTSLTTIAGLTPMLMETSMQAQILIPMAVSLCFGLMFATLLILILVPLLYQTLDNLFGIAPRPELAEEVGPN